MKEIIFFDPIFKERIWGGSRLRTLYNMPIPSEHTGECWLISGHPEGQAQVKGGTFSGMPLQTLWQSNRNIFGALEDDVFPLLIKIIDAQDDLSVQVHPDDAYALIKGNGAKGKTECWYILDCEPSGEIILGHNARTQEELVSMVTEGKWDAFLQKQPVHKGDFIYVPSGTVHALTRGTLVLEIQQPSDTTYRFYDYGRLENGKPRALHIQESIDVTTVPYTPCNPVIPVTKSEGLVKSILTENIFFSVYRFEIQGKATLVQDMPFQIICVIEGRGTIDGIPVKHGDYWLLPKNYGDYTLEGSMTLIVSTKEK